MADTNYFDVDFYANTTPSGSIKEYYAGDAIKNAFVSWLSSGKGEYVMNPTLGGPLDSYVFKNFSTTNAELIKFKLRATIDNNFYPKLILRSLDVTPNFTDRVWEINIQYYIPQTDETGTVEVFPKDISDAIDLRTKIRVEYTGDNLTNFVILKQSELLGKQITYNSNTGYWEWDVYQFINFNSSSPNFAAIISLING